MDLYGNTEMAIILFFIPKLPFFGKKVLYSEKQLTEFSPFQSVSSGYNDKGVA